MGSTFLKNDFEHFRSTKSPFRPPNGKKKTQFIICSCSCCSIARSVRYVLAPCPLRKQPVAPLLCSFRLQALFAKTMVCIALAILWISCATCCFLYGFHALHTPFCQLFVTFFETLLPALVGEHDFENRMKVKSCQKELLRPSNRTDYTNFGSVDGTWNLQNRWGNVYFLFMDPFWKRCLPLCVVPHAFYMTFLHFRNAFVIILVKNGLYSRNSHRTNMEG